MFEVSFDGLKGTTGPPEPIVYLIYPEALKTTCIAALGTIGELGQLSLHCFLL
jgi:hypothetical protein